MNSHTSTRRSLFRRKYGASLQELAKRYCVSIHTVWCWDKEGKLTPSSSYQHIPKPLYTHLNKSLSNISHRCSNPNDKRYVNYGGRGVRNELTIHDLAFLWLRDKADLLRNPSVDRIDSNDHYTLANCRFIEFDANRRKKPRTKKTVRVAKSTSSPRRAR